MTAAPELIRPYLLALPIIDRTPLRTNGRQKGVKKNKAISCRVSIVYPAGSQCFQVHTALNLKQ
jgi:hypothetical protein